MSNGSALDHQEPKSWRLIARYAGVGCLAGLLLGLLEATLLSRNLSAVLLEPAVSLVIWLLGPLVDGIAAGVVGLIAGMTFAYVKGSPRGRRVLGLFRHHWPAIVLVTCCIVAIGAARALTVSRHPSRVLIETALIICLSSSALVVGCSLRLRSLWIILVTAFAFLFAGVAVYSAKSPIPRAARVETKAESGSPNIILITLDTVRADHLSLYGYGRQTSPHLTNWAQRGVVFNNAIAPSSWTLPSHVSMFTGLLPHQHSADWYQPMDTEVWTLAEALRSRGYATAGFTSNYWYGMGGWGIDRGFEVYDDDSTTIRHNLRSLLLGTKLLEPFYYRAVRPDYFERRDAREINRDVFNWLRSRSQRPIFLFVNYYDAHDPYLPRRSPMEKSGPRLGGLIERTLPAFKTGVIPEVPLEDREALIKSYDDCLASLDDAVNELLDGLAHAPGWENSIVVITSDHGESFGEHRRYSHGLSLYREVLWVPLIILGSGVPSGVRISRLVTTQDLFATVLEFAKLATPYSYRVGLERYWTSGSKSADKDECVVSELMPEYPEAGLLPLISLMTPEWHYIRNSRGKVELYRWPSDPAEKSDLASGSRYSQVERDLQNQLVELVGTSRRPWRRPQYVSALDEPGRPFVVFAASMGQELPASLPPPHKIGDVQAALPPKAASALTRPQSSDADLLRSLPYH